MSKVATVVFDDDQDLKFKACVYHQTKVVRWNSEYCVLDSGGYRTAATKRRMNEIAKEFCLDFEVFQRGGEWFVRLPWKTSGGTTVPFTDKMGFQIG